MEIMGFIVSCLLGFSIALILLKREETDTIRNINNWLSTSKSNEWVSYEIYKELEEKNEQFKEMIKELELENAKHIGDGEWDIRDITYRHGKFRLEEWGERYHQFYDGDKALEDEEVVSLLFENEQLKKRRV